MDGWQIGGQAAAALVPAVFILIAIFAPYQPDLSQPVDIPLPELTKQYRRWELAAFLPIVVFTGLFTALWYGLFHFLQQMVFSQQPNNQFLVLPAPAFWHGIALFLGLICSAWPTNYLYAHLLGAQRFREYNHYINAKMGFDAYRLYCVLAFGTVAAAAIISPLALDCYTRFTKAELVESGFWSLGETTHAYADVQELRNVAKHRAPSGKIVDKPYLQIVFKDGYIWSSNHLVMQPTPEQARKILAFVAQQTNRKLVDYQLAPEQQ